MEKDIKIHKNTGKQLLYILMAVLFCFICAFALLIDVIDPYTSAFSKMAGDGFTYWLYKLLFLTGVLLFGYAAVFFIKQAVHPKPVLVVNEQGVTDHTSAISLGFIPWQDIKRVYLDRLMNNTFIELEIAQEEKYLSRLNALKRKTVAANKAMGHQIVCITLNATGTDPRDLAPIMQEMLEKARAEAL